MRGIREKFLRESHAFDAQDLTAMKQLQFTDIHRYQVAQALPVRSSQVSFGLLHGWMQQTRLKDEAKWVKSFKGED